jgi:hypothetical protein
MNTHTKSKLLKISLAAIGLFFIFGLGPVMHYFPDSWGWEPPQYEYEQMIMGIYATLGVFLLIASRQPSEHHSLIWFTVWSSIVHGGIMMIQAIVDVNERANLYGDVPALFGVAIVLALLMPRRKQVK